MENIFNEIRVERNRQDQKWGEQNHTPIEWIPILGEEFGEVSKAALETYFINKSNGKEVTDYSDYREELIQVAAVAVSMIQCLDRNM